MKHPLSVCLLLLATLMIGCRSINSELIEAQNGLVEKYDRAHDQLTRAESEPLAWEDAIEILDQQNLDLKQARNDVIQSKENIERVFLDLLPGVSLSANLARALTDIGNVDKDDLRLSINAFVNIPGIVNMRSRYYASTLSHIRSQWVLLLKKREQRIRLYELFIRYESLERQRNNLEQTNRWEVSEAWQNRLNSNPETLEREQRLFNLDVERDNIRIALAELLGSFEKNWIPQPETLPKLPYSEEPLSLEKHESYGTLVRQLQAAQLEANRLALEGINLQYWPDYNINLNSPSLYSYSGGRTQDWSIDDVIFSATANMRLDTQLRIAYRKRSLTRQIEIHNERLSIEIAKQQQQLIAAQKELSLVNKRLRITELRLRSLEEIRRFSSLDEWRSQLNNIIILSDQRAQLKRQKNRIESLFWMVDDSQWQTEIDINEK